MERFVIPILRIELQAKFISLHDALQELKVNYTKSNQIKIIERLQNSIVNTFLTINDHNLLEFTFHNLKKIKKEKAKIIEEKDEMYFQFYKSGIPNIEQHYHYYKHLVGKVFLVNGAANIMRCIAYAFVEVCADLDKMAKRKTKQCAAWVGRYYDKNVKDLKECQPPSTTQVVTTLHQHPVLY